MVYNLKLYTIPFPGRPARLPSRAAAAEPRAERMPRVVRLQQVRLHPVSKHFDCRGDLCDEGGTGGVEVDAWCRRIGKECIFIVVFKTNEYHW